MESGIASLAFRGVVCRAAGAGEAIAVSASANAIAFLDSDCWIDRSHLNRFHISPFYE